MKKNNRLILSIFIVLLVVLFLTILIRTFANRAVVSQRSASDMVEVVDPETGDRIIFHGDGYIEKITVDGSTFTAWESSKTASFFDYIFANFQPGLDGGYYLEVNGQSGGLPEDDELIDAVIDDINGEDDDPDDGGAGQFFSSPTPGSGGTAGSGSPGGNGGSGGGGSGPGPSWCKHWKLSYCADPPAAPPTPTPTSTYPPGVIDAQNCDEWNEQSEHRTVISNTGCLQ